MLILQKISDTVKMHCIDISLKYQYCRAAVGMGIPMDSPVGIWYGMGMGTVMKAAWACVGLLWRFSNGREINRKRVKHAINVVVAF